MNMNTHMYMQKFLKGMKVDVVLIAPHHWTVGTLLGRLNGSCSAPGLAGSTNALMHRSKGRRTHLEMETSAQVRNV